MQTQMFKPPFIIGISGPPRSGKDTFCGYLLESLEAQKKKVGILRMSQPLKLLAVQMLPEQKWGKEALKDTPFGMYTSREDGRIPATYRRVQIELYRLGAELFGPDWLGHHFIRSIYHMRHLDFILMPDCGRPEDLQPILNSEIPFSHVKVQRNGTTYEGDSRVDFTLLTSIEVPNNGSLSDLKAYAEDYAKTILSHKTGIVLPEALTSA